MAELDLSIIDHPMPLIHSVGDKLEINSEAVEQLSQLNKPLIVVAIGGLFRTGKSYLINCLAGHTPG